MTDFELKKLKNFRAEFAAEMAKMNEELCALGEEARRWRARYWATARRAQRRAQRRARERGGR